MYYLFMRIVQALRKYIILILIILAVSGVIAYQMKSTLRIEIDKTIAKIAPEPKKEFPDIDLNKLNSLQKTIIDISKDEYYKKPSSFDENVLKYSQGAKEPWCANYISWVMKQAGVPYVNPHSNNWRIPGVNTLQEYYSLENRYIKAGSYIPQVGDAAIYLDNNSHVNLVIDVNDNIMTTIGGNEEGHLRIKTQNYSYGTQGLSGFGILSSN